MDIQSLIIVFKWMGYVALTLAVMLVLGLLWLIYFLEGFLR